MTEQSLWNSIVALGINDPYKPPFLWHRHALGSKELVLALDELGTLYVDLCLHYQKLHEEATELGALISQKISSFERNVSLTSTAWSSINLVDRVCRAIYSDQKALRMFRGLDQGLQVLEETKSLSRVYRNLDAHRIEQFSNNAKKRKHPPLRGLVGFVYSAPGTKIEVKDHIDLDIHMIFTDVEMGEQGSQLADIENYPKPGSQVRYGASCISLFLGDKTFDLSADVKAIIQALSSCFRNLDNQITAQLPAENVPSANFDQLYATLRGTFDTGP